MLSNLIPTYREDRAELRRIASAGYIMCFSIQPMLIPQIENTYPEGWRTRYMAEQFMYGDPIFQWAMTQTGTVRWSQVATPDDRGILQIARQYGLVYGAAFARVENNERCFLTVARPDRELRDSELDGLDARFGSWVAAWRERPCPNADQLEALRCARDGLTQQDAGKALGISASAVKQRLKAACYILRAENTTQAVAIAVARGYI